MCFHLFVESREQNRNRLKYRLKYREPTGGRRGEHGGLSKRDKGGREVQADRYDLSESQGWEAREAGRVGVQQARVTRACPQRSDAPPLL